MTKCNKSAWYATEEDAERVISLFGQENITKPQLCFICEAWHLANKYEPNLLINEEYVLKKMKVKRDEL